MKFKLIVISAVCFSLYVQPAHSGDISNMKSAAINTVQEIASIVPKMVKAKGSAVVKAAADMASILATGAGLKVKALGKASSSIKHAIADGLYAIGETITKGGNTITGDYPNYNGPNSAIRVRPSYNARCAIDPCDQEVVELKVSPPTYQRYAPSVWKTLRNAAQRRIYGRGRFVNIGHGIARRPPFVYEIVYSPRLYQGPMGTFRIQKK